MSRSNNCLPRVDVPRVYLPRVYLPSVAVVSCLLAMLLLSPTWASAVEPVESHKDAIDILEKTWSQKQQARALSDSIFNDRKAAGTVDVDTAYAYLLAKIRQRDVRKAIPAAEYLLKLDPSHVTANHARTWLLLLARKQPDALAALKAFDAANDKSDSLDDESRLQNLQSIGRMYGYLEGPMESEVTAADMRVVLNAILADASDPQKVAFEESRSEVLALYQDIINDRAATKEDLLTEAKKEQKEKLDELAEKSEKLAEQEKQLAPQRDKVSAEGLAAIAAIREKAVPIESELGRLNSEAFSVRVDLNNLISDAAYYESLAFAEENPRLRDRYLYRADTLRISARRADTALNGLYRRIRSLSFSLDQVGRELRTAQSFYGAKLDAVNKALQNVDKEQKRTAGQKNRAKRTPRASGGRTKVLENRAKGITTYEDFPVEIERDKLLTRLKSSPK